MAAPSSGRRSSHRHYLNILIYMVADYVMLVLAMYWAFGIRELLSPFLSTVFVLPWSYHFIYVPGIFIITMALAGAYVYNRPSLDVFKDVFWGIMYAFVIGVFVIYMIQVANKMSRLYVSLFLVTSIICVMVGRVLVGNWLKRMPWIKEQIIVIGAGKTAECVQRYLSRDICYRYEIIGIIDDHPVSDTLPDKYPLLGRFSQAADIIQENGINTVLVAAPGLDKDALNQLLVSIQPHVRNILFTPDLVGTPLGSVQIQTLFSEQVTMLKTKNNLARRSNRLVKRIFDLFLVLISLPVIIPVLVILGIIVKLDSPGPVFYNAQRLGENGKLFKCYKFRSMYVDGDDKLGDYLEAHPDAAAEWKEFAKLRDYDPRVTKAGNWMRRTSLDELPQLINVLLGNMSLVGPRPYLPREEEQMGDSASTVCMIKPGITGFWQVSGRSDVTFVGRVAMDEWYVRNWSVWLDILFLFKTFGVVLFKKGAY